MSLSTGNERKKPFSSLEKDLFLSIILKYDNILSCKQTNASNVSKKKSTWEAIKREFNTSSIITQQASTKQLLKLWYNMKAKAKAKMKDNDQNFTGSGPCVADMDMDPLDTKNILTNIEVDIDSDSNGTVINQGDDNKAWTKQNNKMIEETKLDYSTSIPNNINKNAEGKFNKIDFLRCKILEEELEHKREIHKEELKLKILEREYKEKLLKVDLEIKYKILNSMDN